MVGIVLRKKRLHSVGNNAAHAGSALPSKEKHMTTWKIDPSHSGIHFTVRHMMVSKVRGAFGRWEGSVEFDERSPKDAKVQVRIEAASIDTREAKRDEHLRSPDFFDVQKYPEVTFRSSKVEKVDEKTYRITGELTLHGVTRQVTLDAEALGGGKDPWGNQRIGFQAETSLNRKDFGLGWNQVLEAGGVLVGEKVDISLDVQAVASASASVAA
jgi:polyisoprenoid-binding protein YceI